ncbi:MAG: glucose-6-phosphate dehydrogenase assembly protein OpcA [Luteolibacter sp.]
MSSTISEKYSELGKEVEISQIDKELHSLWEQDEARTNATLMNLVVYSEEEGSLLENSRIINNLTQENACRAILVEIAWRGEPDLRAWITAHCHLSHGHKSVCCEQIAFHLTGYVTGRFRNTVFAHLNSDLPLIYWWQGPLSEVFTERLAAVIDRLIVDSSRWDNVRDGFERISQAVEGNTTLTVQDLAWTRCWQYRVAIAALFDDSLAHPLLTEVEKITIRHRPRNINTALQLLAWLAAQAGWKVAGKNLLETKTGSRIAVELISDEDSSALGLVELSSQATTVRVSQEKDSNLLSRELIAGEYHVSSYAPADPADDADLVAVQLARGGKNSLFLRILPSFLELLD